MPGRGWVRAAWGRPAAAWGEAGVVWRDRRRLPTGARWAARAGGAWWAAHKRCWRR
ncbi:hypothetical protein DEU35_3128 [Microbacterium sp. AG157]|nr:hypothetical protein DEU35_3128 [Microbacterium sp. AG157]